MEITLAQIDELWNSQEQRRESMRRARRYYEGQSDIMARNAKYSSGVKKSNVPTNWAGYAVDLYTGAMTDNPYQITQDDDMRAGVEAYATVVQDEDLNSIDVENLRNALICGYGIELHEFVDGDIKVLPERPENWALLHDENDNLIFAVTRYQVQKGGVFRDEIQATAIEVQYTYSATGRDTYRRQKQYSQTGGRWEQIESQPYAYGRPPVIEVKVNRDRIPLLSKPLLAQIDEYEQIDSLSGDDIRHTADAILMLKGVDPAWVTKHSELINSQRVLPIPEDAHAEYLTRNTDTARVTDRLGRSREAIHIMAGVPDVQQIVGSTGGTSGIALQLKFMPMQQKAGAMAKELAKSIRQRIDTFNSVMGRTRQETIDNYKVIIGFSMPINRIEEWMNIKGLDGVVSHRTQLELLSDIDDAGAELNRLERDMVTQADIATAQVPAEVQAQRQDAAVAQTTQSVDATIQTSLDIIGDRLLAAFTRNQQAR